MRKQAYDDDQQCLRHGNSIYFLLASTLHLSLGGDIAPPTASLQISCIPSYIRYPIQQVLYNVNFLLTLYHYHTFQ